MSGALTGQKITHFTNKRLALISDIGATYDRSILVAPCSEIDAKSINQMVSLSGGIVFAALSPQRAAAFLLSPMGRPLTSISKGSHIPLLNGYISVEAREGVSTGISTSDRATTLRVLGAEHPNPRQLVKPGHIFPIQTRKGGILVRRALPEAALDSVALAGFSDAAAFIDLLNSSGNFISTTEAIKLATEHHLPHFSIDELIHWRLEHEKLITRIAEAKLPTHLAGEIRACIYRSSIHEGEHVALIKGEIDSAGVTLTRVQPECTFTDVFGGSSPPSRDLLHISLRAIGERGNGVLIYLRRPSSGQLREQVVVQESSNMSASAGPSVEHRSDQMHDYGLGAQILRDLGVRRLELLTNSQRDLSSINAFGLEVVRLHRLNLEN